MTSKTIVSRTNLQSPCLPLFLYAMCDRKVNMITFLCNMQHWSSFRQTSEDAHSSKAWWPCAHLWEVWSDMQRRDEALKTHMYSHRKITCLHCEIWFSPVCILCVFSKHHNQYMHHCNRCMWIIIWILKLLGKRIDIYIGGNFYASSTSAGSPFTYNSSSFTSSSMCISTSSPQPRPRFSQQGVPYSKFCYSDI